MPIRHSIKTRLFARRSWPLWCAAACVLALAAWVCPQRSESLVTVDGRRTWSAAENAAPREIAWQPPDELAQLLPPGRRAEISHPHLADGGATLYLTVRLADGDADLYRSQLVGGRWQPATAMVEWNTPWDEQAVAVSADGREVYFASNRRGGLGGFDLYVCRRLASGWSLPKNVGAPINTAHDEHDPALSPDALQLFFGSTRAGENAPAELYAARRPAIGKPWSEPAEFLPAAFAGANQRSPYVTADGAWLYFASDRPIRSGEPPNFDLYRAPLADPTAKAENLGRGVNTAANERDPCVAAEGFAVLFASNRGEDGSAPKLYRSTAAEVRRVTVWDTSRWQALKAVWSKAFLATLLLVGVLAAFYYSREWLWEKASLARFLAASLLVHALLVWLMLIVPLSQEIVERVEKIRVSQTATELVDDNLHQSHLIGKQAYEKVADLHAPEPVAMPEVARQVVTPQNMPLRTDTPLPTLPADFARRLPADRSIFVPAQRSAPGTAQETVPRGAAPMRLAELAPQAVALPERVEQPKEQPLARALDLARSPASALSAHEAPVPKREPPRLPAAPLEPDAVERDPSPAPDAVRLARSMRGATIANAELDPDRLSLTSAPLPAESNAEPAAVMLPRANSSSLTPTTGERESPASVAPLPSAVAAQNVAPAPSTTERAKIADKIELSRSQGRATALAALADEKPADLAAVELAREQPVEKATIELAPAMLAPLELNDPLSHEAGGPRRPREPQLVIGAVAERAVDAAPSASPLATQLNRPQARATPVAYAEDNIGMQAMFSLRQGDTRREFIDLVGGNEQSEEAVRRGLKWLAEHQHADGHWSLHQLDPPEKKLPATPGAGGVQSDTAATGLGLLPFLGSGHTHLAGEYQEVVAKAVAWLVEHQKPNGDLFADPPSNAYMYSHGIAAIALCESYGLSQDDKLRDAAQRSLDFIVAAQHSGTGGWRYRPGEPGDMSVVGWQVMALKSGEMAGLNVPQATLDAASKWLATAAGNGGAMGTFGYQGPGGTPAMTAEGLLCWQFLGSRRNDPRIKAGAEYLLKNLPQPGAETSYYWYYATQVMYHMQGAYWTAWNERLRDMLVAAQSKDGPTAGSWDPRDGWEQQGGRLYATSLRLLMLEVYYRHLPLYGALE